MLKQKDLFLGEIDKVKIAIKRLQNFEPPEGYYLAFSGGKDSIVIKALADMSKVKYDAHYGNTTIDPPELIYFIRKYHPDVKFEHPKRPFLSELVKRGFPMRQSRWCCYVYKEGGGIGRMVITGVRWEESYRRKNRKMIENCFRISKRFLNVIIDWTEQEVWEFIKKFNLPYCKLYDKDWKRIGCLMCPCAKPSERIRMAREYPKHRNLFIKAFERLYQNRKKRGMESVDRWENGEAMFWWWLKGVADTKDFDQTIIFE